MYQLIRPLRYYVYVRKAKLVKVCVLEIWSLVKLEPDQAHVFSVFSALLYLRLTDEAKSIYPCKAHDSVDICSYVYLNDAQVSLRLCVGKRGHLSDAVRKIEGRGQVFHLFLLSSWPIRRDSCAQTPTNGTRVGKMTGVSSCGVRWRL